MIDTYLYKNQSRYPGARRLRVGQVSQNKGFTAHAERYVLNTSAAHGTAFNYAIAPVSLRAREMIGTTADVQRIFVRCLVCDNCDGFVPDNRALDFCFSVSFCINGAPRPWVCAISPDSCVQIHTLASSAYCASVYCQSTCDLVCQLLRCQVLCCLAVNQCGV